MSQNLLSTMFLTAGYDYDLNEQTGKFRTKIIYKGWFPEVSAEISTGNRAASQNLNGVAQRFTWQETNTDLSIGQSLDFSRGHFNRGIFGEATYTNSKISHNPDTPENYIRGTLSALSYRLFAYTYARQAYRDLAPRLGINADFMHRLDHWMQVIFSHYKPRHFCRVYWQTILWGSMLVISGPIRKNIAFKT
jgi:hypothetical protein